MTPENNQRVISEAFDAWVKGVGGPFDLLTDDMTWVITGTSAVAGTYRSRQEFMDRAIAPINARLATPIRPTVRKIIAEGDTVVVLWDGHATARDGAPYDNTYCWIMRLADGRDHRGHGVLRLAAADRPV